MALNSLHNDVKYELNWVLFYRTGPVIQVLWLSPSLDKQDTAVWKNHNHL